MMKKSSFSLVVALLLVSAALGSHSGGDSSGSMEQHKKWAEEILGKGVINKTRMTNRFRE